MFGILFVLSILIKKVDLYILDKVFCYFVDFYFVWIILWLIEINVNIEKMKCIV